MHDLNTAKLKDQYYLHEFKYWKKINFPIKNDSFYIFVRKNKETS